MGGGGRVDGGTHGGFFVLLLLIQFLNYILYLPLFKVGDKPWVDVRLVNPLVVLVGVPVPFHQVVSASFPFFL